MRYDKGHKDTTRRHILEVASRQFREGGIAAVGMAGLMSRAGLTNGAFYTHFASKEALVRDALVDALEESVGKIEAAIESGAGLEGFIRDYLSPRHRDNPGRGCVAAALAAEVSRHPAATRGAFTDKFEEVVALIATHIPVGGSEAKRRKALGIYGLLIGTVQLARVVSDKRLSDELLTNGLHAALQLMGA